MSNRKQVLRTIEKKNNKELKTLAKWNDPLLETAKNCSADGVIRRHARDSYERDTLTHPLVSHGLMAAIFSELQQQPEEANSYAKLLGKYLLPLCSIEPQGDSVPCEIGSTQQVFCSDTEQYFIDALKQINEHKYFGQPRLSVYHNKEGLPVALRKGAEESSAILLQNVNVGRVFIPEGTFVGVCKDSRVELTGEVSAFDEDNYWLLSSYCIDDDFMIAPGRLSPWAHKSSALREVFSTERYTNLTLYYDDRSKQCAKHDIKKFKKASKKILEQTGIYN